MISLRRRDLRAPSQEPALKILNRWCFAPIPLPAASAFPEDACRRPTSNHEWQGTAAAIIKNAYGGDGLPNATFSDTLVPAGWSGQASLYQNVVAPACRACHIARGTILQSDIDLNTYQKFVDYADDIKYHVIDRGNMPLALPVFNKFWSTSMADTLATFLQGQALTVRDASGAVLKPGRPVADPGPNRVIRQGTTTLSAAGSQFANRYNWSIISGPNGTIPPTNVTLTSPNSVQPAFNATADGTYVLQLVVSNGTAQSAPAALTLVVNNLLNPAPAAIRFAHIKTLMQTPGAGGCIGCHNPAFFTPPPLFLNKY